jgi:hypothetical protein
MIAVFGSIPTDFDIPSGLQKSVFAFNKKLSKQ